MDLWTIHEAESGMLMAGELPIESANCDQGGRGLLKTQIRM